MLTDARRAYNNNGIFDSELWYLALYNEIPNKFEYSVPDSMMVEASEIKVDAIKDKFKKIDAVRKYNEMSVEEPSEVKKGLKDILNYDVDLGGFLSVAADHKVFLIKKNGIVAYYKDDNLEDLSKLVQEIFASFPLEKQEEKKGKINLIKVYQGDYYTSENDVKPMTVDIEENYNDDFQAIHKATVDFLNDRSSGLLLFYGKPGTGKTSYIRHLCTTVPKEYIVVPNSIASRLGDPDLISFITDHTDSVFILEDCEQLLEDRSENIFNNSINTILNMSDGLLSDVCNIKFICTFNAPINKIDTALLRKGRCIAKYEFGDLCAEKVQILNDKYELGHKEIKPMTLAEVYNPDAPDYMENREVNKIGF
jgi:SpoVK/Ycf46/Vps4 family AAA+-type ATPase